MKRFICALVMLGMLLSAVCISGAAELLTPLAINTDPFACDGSVRYYVWWNPEPVAIRLQWTRVWQGVLLGGKADFSVNLYVYKSIGQYPPYRLIHMTGWDHYAEPTAPVMSVWDYGPHWVTIPVGQGILMETRCAATTGGIQAHAAAFVGYTR